MTRAGEIPPGELIYCNARDYFVDIDHTKQRVFYVPRLIHTYNERGQMYRGLFLLDDSNGVAIEKTASVDPEAHIAARVIIGAGSKIRKQVKIDEGSVIEDRVYISQCVSIGKNCIIGRRSSVREETQIKDEVQIGLRTWVDERCRIETGVTIPNNSHIPPDTIILDSPRIGDYPEPAYTR